MGRPRYDERMPDPLLIERTGDVVVWTLNRPETRNAISESDMIEALVAAIKAVNADPTVCAVILTGSGSAFCSGGNIKDMRDKAGMFGGDATQIEAGYRDGIQQIPRAFQTLEVPAIAAVNGPAVGAGCDLALMCDIRLASTTAKFAESFIKVGLIPGDGGAWLLPRAVGMSRASEMTYTGDAIDAHTAEQWGLVSQVVEPETLLEAAHAVAQRIASNPAQILRMTKKLLRSAQVHSLDEVLEDSARMQAVAHHSDEHREAVAVMLAKTSRS